MTLTEASHEVFMTYAKDASNWRGVPWVTDGNVHCTNEMRGNLSDLEKKGLCRFVYDHCQRDKFVEFTQAGKDYAEKHGVELY